MPVLTDPQWMVHDTIDPVCGRKPTKSCTLLVSQTDPTGVTIIPKAGKGFRIFLRLPWSLVVFIVEVVHWNVDRTAQDITICSFLAINNVFAARYGSQASRSIQTSRQYWSITGTQGNIQKNLDWPTTSCLTWNVPEKSSEQLAVCGGDGPLPLHCFDHWI